MARIILINPPTKNKSGSPLLSQMYLASSLLEHDHDVKVFDLNAKYFEYDLDLIIKKIFSYKPEIIGITIYTPTASPTYEFVTRLREKSSTKEYLLVAGGPHTTAVPNEPLEHMFDVVVRGEGENTITEFAGVSNDINQFKDIKGISYRTPVGKIHHTQTRQLIKNLDKLPMASKSLHLFEPRWYLKNGTFHGVPAGMLTSRGCPGKCIFCANTLMGRRVRYRTLKNVLDEIRYNNEMYGTTFFSFWDDCFTANIKYVEELCEKLINLRKLDGVNIQWSCNSRANRMSRTLLQDMKTAGCISITFGIESGSLDTLYKIRKGIDLDNVEKLLHWCKEFELRTQVNFMLGFPWESEKHLLDTLDYMKRINGLVDAFSTHGVVIPFPGTALYEMFKVQYGFENWWLDRDMIDNFNNRLQEPTETMVGEIDRSIYLKDPILDMNFFNYSKNIKKIIKKCLEFKGKQTLNKIKFQKR